MKKFFGVLGVSFWVSRHRHNPPATRLHEQCRKAEPETAAGSSETYDSNQHSHSGDRAQQRPLRLIEDSLNGNFYTID